MANRYNSKLTPELSKDLCNALSKGYSIPAACSLVDIVESTYYNWYDRGKNAKSGQYRQFYCDVTNARNKATQRAEKVILDVIPESPQDAKWWLTKHRPDIYVDRVYNETKVDAKVETDVTVNLLDKVKQKRKELNDIRSNKE